MNWDPTLNQIYELLDHNRYTKAIKLIENQLAKQPENQLYLSLKAVALARSSSGNPAEASSICDKLINAKTPIMNENILRHLGLALKDLTQWDKAVTLYERSFNHLNVPDPRIGEMLFLSLVRCEQFNKQQIVAQKLNKAYPQERKYLFWAIVSMVSGYRSQNNDLMVTVASKQLSKTLDSYRQNPAKVTTEEFGEIVRYHVTLLMSNKDYNGAIQQVLLEDEPFGKTLEPFDRKSLLAECWHKSGGENVSLSNALYIQLLENEK
ncbi:hypothetical protein AKO1_008997 [Acrasis kona]|uniref:Tetratricopeptide repeat protein n=1 Tax=Acrasis kona TaxID=1008807 RepID=A0AAW2YH95_9EUKA